MKIINIQSLEEFKNIIKNNSQIFLNVSATWCKPCQNIKYDLENYVNNYNSDSLFLKLDFDVYENEEEFLEFITIKKLPTFAIFNESILTNQIISSDLEIIKKFILDECNNNLEINENF